MIQGFHLRDGVLLIGATFPRVAPDQSSPHLFLTVCCRHVSKTKLLLYVIVSGQGRVKRSGMSTPRGAPEIRSECRRKYHSLTRSAAHSSLRSHNRGALMCVLIHEHCVHEKRSVQPPPGSHFDHGC